MRSQWEFLHLFLDRIPRRRVHPGLAHRRAIRRTHRIAFGITDDVAYGHAYQHAYSCAYRRTNGESNRSAYDESNQGSHCLALCLSDGVADHCAK